jgi:hypothetical protein
MAAVDKARKAGFFGKVRDVIEIAAPTRWRIGFLQGNDVGGHLAEQSWFGAVFRPWLIFSVRTLMVSCGNEAAVSCTRQIFTKSDAESAVP